MQQAASFRSFANLTLKINCSWKLNDTWYCRNIWKIYRSIFEEVVWCNVMSFFKSIVQSFACCRNNSSVISREAQRTASHLCSTIFLLDFHRFCQERARACRRALEELVSPERLQELRSQAQPGLPDTTTDALDGSFWCDVIFEFYSYNCVIACMQVHNVK